MRLTVVGWLIATTLPSAACHTMRPVALEELGAIRPTRVWVTRADQSVVVVEGPRVLESGLVGFVNGSYEEMPADDVKRVLMRRSAGGRTAALVAAGAVGLTTAAFLMAGGKSSYQHPCTSASSECDPNSP
jgi:hypothetical protein